jgi:hypothetical protein
MFKLKDMQVFTVGFFGITMPLVKGIDIISSIIITILTATYLILKIRGQWLQNKKK